MMEGRYVSGAGERAAATMVREGSGGGWDRRPLKVVEERGVEVWAVDQLREKGSIVFWWRGKGGGKMNMKRMSKRM